jgi:hypothetical protein
MAAMLGGQLSITAYAYAHWARLSPPSSIAILSMRKSPTESTTRRITGLAFDVGLIVLVRVGLGARTQSEQEV